MKQVTLSFQDLIYEDLKEDAEALGLSVSQLCKQRVLGEQQEGFSGLYRLAVKREAKKLPITAAQLEAACARVILSLKE